MESDFAAAANQDEPDGLTPERAIIVNGVAEEYAWVRAHRPGWELVTQRLMELDDKPYDVRLLLSPDGDQVEVYFDISAFFGKGKQPGPPCPYCGAALRTAKARQCRTCGTDWHDSSGVIRRDGRSPR